MPEATAQLVKPTIESPVRVDDSLNQLRQGIGANADLATGNKGVPHDPVPIKEQKPTIPNHVPSGETVDTNDHTFSLPGSHKSNKFLDNIGNVVPDIDLVNPDHVPNAAPRVGNVTDITEVMKQKAEDVLKAKNEPNKEEKGIFDWFYHTKKKAA